MTFEEILTIHGKPGIYQLVARNKGSIVAKSILDGKSVSVRSSHPMNLLAEIAIYTLKGEMPLREIMAAIHKKEEGKPAPVNHKDPSESIEAYFFEIVPDFDEDRVYVSDMRKVILWYNILVDKNITDFLPKEVKEPAPESPVKDSKKPKKKKNQ